MGRAHHGKGVAASAERGLDAWAARFIREWWPTERLGDAGDAGDAGDGSDAEVVAEPTTQQVALWLDAEVLALERETGCDASLTREFVEGLPQWVVTLMHADGTAAGCGRTIDEALALAVASVELQEKSAEERKRRKRKKRALAKRSS